MHAYVGGGRIKKCADIWGSRLGKMEFEKGRELREDVTTSRARVDKVGKNGLQAMGPFLGVLLANMPLM